MKNSVTFRQLCFRFYGTLLVLCMLLPVMVQAQFGPKGTCRAMVVGISEYQDPDIPDLRFAHRDAEAFADYLKNRPVDKVKPEHLKLVVNDQATGGNVHSALRSLVKDSQAGDKVVIYFAGHGDVETLYPDEPGHLLVYDTPANNYSSNSLRLDDIRRTVNALVSRDIQVLIVTDACHAGKLAGSAVNGSQAATSSMAEQFNSEVKILSCQSNEFSQEGEQWGDGRGVFSWYLIQGLTGLADADKDLQVTIKELSRYLEDMIEPDVSPQRQTPNLIGDRNARVAVIDEEQLLALRKELDPNFSSSEPVNAAREPESPPAEQIDSVWVKKSAAFQFALDNKRLLVDDVSPGDSGMLSAYDQLQQLKKEYAQKPEVKVFEDQLIAKLQEGAQQAVNAYLKNDKNELIARWKGSTANYQKYPRYLKMAASMLGEEQYLRDRLLALAHYFKAINYRFSAENQIQDRKLRLQQALVQADSALHYEPRCAYIPNELGLIYFRLESLDKAINYYKEALQVAPTWAMPYNNLAIAYSKMNDVQTAAVWASQALQRDSSLFGSYYVLAEYHMLNKANFLAEAALLEGIRRNPEIPQPMMNFANYWIQVDRPEMAEMWYQQVLVKSPVSTINLHDIGVFYANKSDFDRSIYYFQQVVKTDASFTESWYEMGAAYMHKGALKDAKNAFQETLKRQPDHQAALSNLGKIAYDEGDPKLSLQYYNQALNAVGTDFCTAAQGAAAVNLQLGSLAASKKLLTQFLTECVDQPDYADSRKSAFYNLACIESLEGHHHEAFLALKKALDAGFDNENHIRSDADLKALHDKPEWESLLKEYFQD